MKTERIVFELENNHKVYIRCTKSLLNLFDSTVKSKKEFKNRTKALRDLIERYINDIEKALGMKFKGDNLWDKFDMAIKIDGIFSDRSEAIRSLMRDYINDYKNIIKVS